MICAVSIMSEMDAERLRQATAFKISYHMVKITSQVQKIRSGCIFLNIARRASKSYQHRGPQKPDDKVENLET